MGGEGLGIEMPNMLDGLPCVVSSSDVFADG